MLQPKEMPYIFSNRSEDGSVVDHVYVKDIVLSPHKAADTMAATQLPPLETSPVLNGAPVAPNSPSQSPLSAQQAASHSEPTSASPALAQDTPTSPSAGKPADGALRAPYPQHPHRLSSPPRFSADTPRKPAAPPLQHRHTLEVPRVTRQSQTFGPEETAVANGRFSPTTPQRTRKGSLTLGRRTTHSINSDSYQSDIGHDDDVSRWAEVIRQKRANRRRRKDEEDDDRVVVGTKVDQNHVNWVTAYNMLTGIRFTVSRAHAKTGLSELKKIRDVDFDTQHKFSFDVTGSELTPAAKYDFKFKDYAPEVFMNLRTMFGIQPADYLVSLTSKYILSELGSPGKSGSFFYFSRDYKYIIKTIHHSEHRCLRTILRDYYAHVEKNRDTLLSQFYGLHRVKLPYGRKIHFVVMNNLFPPHRDIHSTFDLKGSTVGRDLKEVEVEKNPRAVLKDLNWLRRDLRLELGPTKKHQFLEQMERDVALLKRLKIMDYSLLVGIHDLEKGNEENLRDKTLQVFQPGGADDDPHPLLADEAALQHLSQMATFASNTQQPNTFQSLTRTPSKIETARKAKELRANLKTQKPVPMGSINASSRNTTASTVFSPLNPAAQGFTSTNPTAAVPGSAVGPTPASPTLTTPISPVRPPNEMPLDSMALDDHRARNPFYADDGGYRATHADDTPGEEIYYLGIIDCLTRYNYVKRGEHFWKELTTSKTKQARRMKRDNAMPAAATAATVLGVAVGGPAAAGAPPSPPGMDVEVEISSVPPQRYGERFVRFMASVAVPRGTARGAAPAAGEREKRSSVDGGAGAGAAQSGALPVVEEKAGEA